MGTTAIIVIVVFALLIGGGILAFVASCYRKVDQGSALIINKMKDEPVVTFTGGVVLPIFHRWEVMNISVKAIEIERRGNEGLICKDNIRADIKVTFFVKVNKTTEDVLKVAQGIGCARASDQHTLEELFVAKFSEALKTVGKRLDFEELYTQRDVFKDQIIDVIGRDLEGYILTDAAIDYLEQTPLDKLDKNNILDASGIRKITEITAGQNVKTNDLRQAERKELGRQNLEADEAVMELGRRRADAEARQQREIASVQARESAEAEKIQAEEHRKSELARIKAAEEIALGNVNKERQVEVAQKDKERVVAIKTEQVAKERQLEILARERAVELQRIEKEKALEVEKKNIADVIRGRIVVDKSVAEEEERIKTMRAMAEAGRTRDVKVTLAEGEAQEKLVKDIKSAEAQEKVAEFKARERLVAAQASLESAEKETQAKIRAAEGTQAQEAAAGLAGARVKEAEALATEKLGLAQVRVTRERMAAEADGNEKVGAADVKIKELQIGLIQAEGRSKAEATRELGAAEADALKARRLAEVHAREAEAVAIEKAGQAEAAVIRSKMSAEAAGLAEKLSAMKAMEGSAREHEEFRLRLEQSKAVTIAKLDAQKAIAESQSRVLAEAFKSADIKIIGGESQFIERFTQAAGLGAAFDGLIEGNGSAQKVLEAATTGGENNLTGLVTQSTLAAVLARMMDRADGPAKEKLASLLAEAKALGLGDHS
jgi:uncharacterized membrane protein YqiK